MLEAPISTSFNGVSARMKDTQFTTTHHHFPLTIRAESVD
ncbi:hypothetical protein SOVF_007140 [Spinacia oleracea]|nr:hypothetical protein SOVF_007140 [Spinacia oleracea]